MLDKQMEAYILRQKQIESKIKVVDELEVKLSDDYNQANGWQ